MHVVCTHANGGREGGNQSVCRWPTSRTMNQSAACWGGEHQQDRRGFVALGRARSSRSAEKLRATHLEASAGGARLGGALLLVGSSTLASFTALAALAAFLLATRHHQPLLAPAARRSHRVLQAQAPQRIKHAMPPPVRARAMMSRLHSITWLLAATSRGGGAQERWGSLTSPAMLVLCFLQLGALDRSNSWRSNPLFYQGNSAANSSAASCTEEKKENHGPPPPSDTKLHEIVLQLQGRPRPDLRPAELISVDTIESLT